MEGPLYLALVADLDDSRQLSPADRAQAQHALRALVDRARERLGSLPVAGPELVSGDRIQVLFPCPTLDAAGLRAAVAVTELIFAIAVAGQAEPPRRLSCSVGLGLGTLSTAIDQERVGRMDGACFHRAEAALLEDAKREKQFLGARGFASPPAGDRALAGSFQALGALISHWTARQSELVLATHASGVLTVAHGQVEFQDEQSRTDVAAQFEIGLPTVSKSLSAARARALPGAMYAAAWQLASIGERTSL